MYICTDTFINNLDEKEENTILKEYLHEVEGGSVRVLQLSDLHLHEDERTSQRRQIEPIVKVVEKIKKKWERSINSSQLSLNSVIVSGDLIDPIKISADNTTTYDQHKFAYDVVDEITRRVTGDKGNSHVLIIPGNHDIERINIDNKSGRERHNKRKKSYFSAIQDQYNKSGAVKISETFEKPCISLIGNKEHGIVLLVGIDSNQNAYHYNDQWNSGLVGEAQLDDIQEVVEILSKNVPNIPIYPIVILHHHLLPIEKFKPGNSDSIKNAKANTVLDSRNIIEKLSKLRVSLITHGHMHSPSIQRIAYWDLKNATTRPTPLHIVASPSLKPNQKQSRLIGGGLVLDFDLHRGTAYVSIIEGTRNDAPVSSIQFPLTSVSRVSAAEMRVNKRLNNWLTNSSSLPDSLVDLPFSTPPDATKVSNFVSLKNIIWKEYGYSLLNSMPKGLELNKLIGENRDMTGILSETDKLGCQLPIIQDTSNILEKKYKLLVVLKRSDTGDYILLNNQIPRRESSFGSWDSPLLPAFNRIGDLIKNLINDLNRIHDDLNVRDLKETDRRYSRLKGIKKALSLVTPLQDMNLQEELVELGTRSFSKFSPVDGQPQIYKLTLTSLPRFSFEQTDEESLAGAIIHLKEITSKHVFRWENADKNQSEDGYVWFPIKDWKSCPAILARNADIMNWVEKEVTKRNPQKSAKWLYCGDSSKEEYKKVEYGIKSVLSIPFQERNQNIIIPEGFPKSLLEGLNNVTYNPDLALNKGKPYKGLSPEMVILRKEKREGRRSRIGVYTPDNIRKGYLRPVQRYVLKSGLNRAEDLYNICSEKGISVTKLASEDYGYLILERPIGNDIALLPPIIERISSEEKECEDDSTNDYIICDGNHRLVKYCWHMEEDVQCILFDTEPKEPYYAHPFSSWDWEITASNILQSQPDLYGKYTPRRSPEGENIYWYRRFYRDFDTGFANIGNQGGTL